MMVAELIVELKKCIFVQICTLCLFHLYYVYQAMNW